MEFKTDLEFFKTKFISYVGLPQELLFFLVEIKTSITIVCFKLN